MDTSQLLLLLPMMTAMMKTSSQDGVSAPGGPRMDSLNMRHVLRWRPLQDNCSTALVYSVQFQGEFELSVLNDSWVDAAGCQRTPGTSCDLTFDLGSDSDYRLRVRAHCGAQTSAWSRSSSPFNRRDTVLTAPLMKVASEGGALRVSLSEPPRLTTLLVEVWRWGEEQATVLTLPPEQTLLLVPTLQVGGEYCARAYTLLGGRRSNGSHTQCVTITLAGLGLREIVASVVATVVVMVTLLAAALWCMCRCHLEDYRRYFRSEPLPLSLRSVWDVRFRSGSEEAEPLEAFSVVMVMLSTDRLLKDGGAAASV